MSEAPLHPNEIRKAISQSAITKAELARRASVHPNSLATVESEDWNPRWKTLEALCAAVTEIKAERA